MLAAGEGVGANSSEKRASAMAGLRAAWGALKADHHIVATFVERPYGTQGQDDEGMRVQSLIDNAISTGWWLRSFELHFPSARHISEVASQWRPRAGIRAANRATAKRLADIIAKKAVEGTSNTLQGPRGGWLGHAAEAICQCISVWVLIGPSPGDAFSSWRQTGSFRGDCR